jgi:hypothetical protein
MGLYGLEQGYLYFTYFTHACLLNIHFNSWNSNTEEGTIYIRHKNNKTYKEEPGKVQKKNYIGWTSG